MFILAVKKVIIHKLSQGHNPPHYIPCFRDFVIYFPMLVVGPTGGDTTPMNTHTKTNQNP